MRVVIVAAILTTAAVLSSCGEKTEVKVRPEANAPVAKVTIEALQEPEGETQLTVEVDGLVPPSRLSPPRSAYVVWLETEPDEFRKLGLLRHDGSRRGVLETTLEAVTPLEQFDLLVTAEDDLARAKPNMAEVILRQHVEAE